MNLSNTRTFSCYRSSFKNVATLRPFCDSVCPPGRKSKTINPHNLPLLPIPKLEHTLRKFLKSAEPFVTPCELETAQDLCWKFQKHEGVEIQKLLIQRAHETHNWLEEWYLKCSYLCNREALPMNTSSVVIFPTEKFSSRRDQINYSAKLILGALEFMKSIKENRLPLETRERHPLDMEVYKKIFSYTRVPRANCDELLHQKGSQHIIVAYNNMFFKVAIMNEEFQPLSFVQVVTTLENVLEYSCNKAEPFGILTSMKRDIWSAVHVDMKYIAENSKYLQDIEKALFVVCLDESSSMTVSSEEDKRLNTCLNGFHGHGPKVNAANRWYDKTLQFFVDPDGSAGFVFEHSPVDVSPLGKMADFLASYVRGSEFMNIPFLDFCEKPTPLNFISNNDTKSAMEIGCKEAQEKSNTFSCRLHQYGKYGKEFCKDTFVDPSSLVQIAIQLAQFKFHGQFAPQEEIVSTRKFYLGRSDVVRSTTCEMLRFIRCIDDPLIFLRDRFDALKDAVRIHRDLAEDAMEGRAIDCHLFGLMMVCKEARRHLPKLFQSRAYLKSSKFKILSMQLPMKSDCIMCYPPSFHGGYAICYNPRKKDINFCVTCRRDDCDTNSKKFLDHWCYGMKNLSDIIRGFSRRHKDLRA